MSLAETVRHFRRVHRATHQELPHQDEYERLADDALKACSEWFGPPTDPQRPIGYAVSADDTSACGYFLGQYIIYLDPTLDTPEERCETVGHEMYHRVTMRRPGLRRERWIDEIMAFLSAQWFLKRHGYDDHARKTRRQYVSRRTRVDIDALRRFRPNPLTIVTRNKSTYFPENFYPDVRRLATALNWVVAGSELVRLPWAKSLPEWIEGLPADRRADVECLFDPSRPDRATPDTPEGDARMGYALQALGRFEEALARLRSAQSRGASQDKLFFDIGLCAERAGHTDAAIDAYLEAIRHNAEDEWAPYNLALIYRKRKDCRAAIEWFEEALRRKPDLSTALCYLGMTLNDDGQRGKARQCWQRIVETGNKDWVTWAKDALRADHDDKTDKNPGDSAA